MEVLETRPISELVTEAVIKVCWVGDTPNANNTLISTEVGKQIAATLPGAPVVGFYNDAVKDFEEHNHQIIITEGNIEIKDLTRPYGFVSFDPPWYQTFIEDGAERQYLMCRAYLWTRQYPEASQAIGKGQSMSLDPDSMSGYYQGDVFVFTDATLQNLTILGDDYAPCFAGAKILSTFSRQYKQLTDAIETGLGRRFYAMNERMRESLKAVPTGYAIRVGWNIEDAIYVQLREHGMDEYGVEGVYQEGSQMFVILQKCDTLEYVRVDIQITEDDAVVLGTDLIPVAQKWVPKEPVNDTVAEPIENTPEAEEGAVPSSATGISEPLSPGPAPEGVPNSYNLSGGESEMPENKEGQVTEPVQEVSDVQPVVTESTAPATDYTQNTEGEDKAKIAALEAELAQYKAREEARIAADRQAVVDSFKEELTEEEMSPVTSALSQFTAQQVEEKLNAILGKKLRAQFKAQTPSVQVDVASIAAGDSGDSSVPEWLQAGIEYDKAHNA